jgi:hypothetical protein
MKTIDFKSAIIGGLFTIILFMVLGFTDGNENYGDIVANSITIVDEDGEKRIELTLQEGDGIVNTFSHVNRRSTTMGGKGYFTTFYKGHMTSYLGGQMGGGGYLQLRNAMDNRVAYIGTQSKNNQNGLIQINDSYGDVFWSNGLGE